MRKEKSADIAAEEEKTMSEQKQPSDPAQDQPGGTPPISNPPPAYQDWRTMRRAERDARHAAREEWRAQRRAMSGSWGLGGWIGGLILILLGVIFLLQNLNLFYLANWWALFILIPAVAAFASAWNMYNLAGRVNAAVRGSLIGGSVLTLIALVFLFNLNWGIVFPLLLILGGVALLVSTLLPS
jgi:hypothetical protein